MVAQGWEEGEWVVSWVVSFWSDTSILELDDSNGCITKYHWMVHFKIMNFMVCELSFNKAKCLKQKNNNPRAEHMHKWAIVTRHCDWGLPSQPGLKQEGF